MRVEAGGRPRTGWGRIVTLDSVSEWRRTGERGAAATGGYSHYPLQTPDYRLGSLWCLQFVVLHRVNFTVERITNVCIGQTSAL